MQQKAATITALMLLASLASAAQPVAIINGPSQCSTTPGIVILDSTGSVSDDGIFSWKATDAQVFLGQNGQVAIIYQSNAPEVVFVTLATAGSINGKITPASAAHTIQFGAAPNPPVPPDPKPPGPIPPVPPTPPSPPTPPTPVLPDGTYGLAKVAYGFAMALPPASRANASAVATCYINAANDCLAGKYADVFAAGTQLDKDVTAALGADAPNWATFTDKTNGLNGAFNALYTHLKIVSFADVATAFKEIAAGLGQVK